MPPPLSEQVVVITGASSGIGRQTALELARRGAAVVLAARSEDALRQLATEIESAGGRALAVPTDVAEPQAVERLADAAVERFGRIDTWVNDAAVAEYAPVGEVTAEEADRLVRVNLLGVIFGTQAALRRMRPRRSGHVINIASVLGVFGVPFQAVYVATKHGVRGFTESVRRELQFEDVPIDVTIVLPPSTNTPFFDHARSKLGGPKPQPMGQAYEPEVVAEAIARACERPQPEVVVGDTGLAFTTMQRISPALIDWALKRGDAGGKGQVSDQPDDSHDNLFTPSGGPGKSHGSFGHLAVGTEVVTKRGQTRPWVKALALGIGAVGLFVLLRDISRPNG
jgi:short-subunit dehydrogenase